MSDHRDPIVARALRSMPVPDHRRGFWAELDARLALIDADRADRAGPRHAAPRVPGAADEVPTLDTDDLAIAEPLPTEHRRERLARGRGALLAAAVLVLVTAAGTALMVTRFDDRDVEPVDVADTPPAVTAAPTTAARPPAPEGSPAAAVRQFVDAIGGNAGTAFAMLTADSQEFLTSPAQLAAGFSESIGAWSAPGAVERKHVMEVRAPREIEAAVVTYIGTVDAEGASERRTQAFAVVREAGEWRISLESTAISASAGPGIEMINPEVAPERECCGIGGSVARGEPIRFTVADVPEIESVTVAVDGGESLDPAQLELTGTEVTVPVQLQPGTHVVTIAVALRSGTLFARAVQFDVA